jgi:hypothetical protein
MKIYISGKISGDNNYRKKFLEAENALYDAGHYPLNPAACVADGTNWTSAMRTALRLMLDSDGVALLRDWKSSHGAKIEVRVAHEVGLPVRPINEWIHGKA